MNRLITLLVLGVGLGLGSVARADEDARQAREHFAMAEAAERRQDWQVAIDEYKLAYALKPHPSVLYNIAADYERLGEPASAVEYYNRYLGGAPGAPDAERVRGRVAELTARVRAAEPAAEGGTGLLVVTADVDGARVLLDGTDLGPAPLSAPVPAGSHRVTVHRDGYVDDERAVSLANGGSEKLRAHLALVPGTSAPGEQRLRWMIQVAFGYDLSELRYIIGVAVRLPGERWDLGATYGSYGVGNVGLGAESRLFAATGHFRPYGRVGASYGHSNAGDVVLAGEAGAGVLFVVRGAGDGMTTYNLLQYVLEVDARYLFVGADDASTSEHRPRVVVAAEVGILIPF